MFPAQNISSTFLYFRSIQGIYHELSPHAFRLWMGLGYQNPMLVTVVDTLSLLFLPVCLNVVFLFLPRNFTAALFLLSLKGLSTFRGTRRSWQNHIPYSAGHSVVVGFWATKKPTHKCVPTTRKKDRPIPCGVASHSCNRLLNSKSKLSFTLNHCRQFTAVLEAAVFS